MSEYELLNVLREEYSVFQTVCTDPLALFRQHFLLFHSLYRLQLNLFQQQQGHLIIDPLRIALLPYQAGTTAQLALPDPLRNYYLDLQNLDKTNAADVTALLDAFWQRLTRTDQRAKALQVLGLCDPVDDAQIQRRYRELVMRHHPDRGGETAQLQILNAALATLLPGKA